MFFILEYLLVFFLPGLLVKPAEAWFSPVWLWQCNGMPGSHCSFLNAHQAALFLASLKAAILLFMAWLSFGAALILSVFSCTWLKLYRRSKITELRKIRLPAAPAGPTASRGASSSWWMPWYSSHTVAARAGLIHLAADVPHSGPFCFAYHQNECTQEAYEPPPAPPPICHHGHIKHWFYFPRSEMMKSISNRASYICSYLFIQIPWHLLNISHCIYFKD